MTLKKDSYIEQAMNFIKKISFPRLVGTENEAKCRDIIENELKNMELKVRCEKLFCSFYPINVAFRYFQPILGLLLILSGIFIYASLTILSLLFGIITIVYGLMLSSLINRQFGVARGRKIETENIIAEIDPKKEIKKTIVLMAHYDSKSQRFKSIYRVLLYLIGLLWALINSALIIYSSVLFLVYPWMFYSNLGNLISPIIGGLFSIILVFNSTGNASPGALDNASAVAIIVELARIFKNERLENSKLIIVASAAEELGLFGAADFVKRHSTTMVPEHTYFINYDSPGKLPVLVLTHYGIPARATSKMLNKMILQIKDEEGIKDLKKIYLPIGAATDHVPIKNAGYNVAVFVSALSNVHTSKDTIENIDKDALYITGFISYQLIKKLDVL